MSKRKEMYLKQFERTFFVIVVQKILFVSFKEVFVKICIHYIVYILSRFYLLTLLKMLYMSHSNQCYMVNANCVICTNFV